MAETWEEEPLPRPAYRPGSLSEGDAYEECHRDGILMEAEWHDMAWHGMGWDDWQDWTIITDVFLFSLSHLGGYPSCFSPFILPPFSSASPTYGVYLQCLPFRTLVL